MITVGIVVVVVVEKGLVPTMVNGKTCPLKANDELQCGIVRASFGTMPTLWSVLNLAVTWLLKG
jgi:hypothetical protein